MRISDWSSDVCSSDLTPLSKYAAANRIQLRVPGVKAVGAPQPDVARVLKASRIASAMAVTASPSALLRRYMTTLDESMTTKPAAAVNSRHSPETTLRASGALARPAASTNISQPPVWLHGRAARVERVLKDEQSSVVVGQV